MLGSLALVIMPLTEAMEDAELGRETIAAVKLAIPAGGGHPEG